MQETRGLRGIQDLGGTVRVVEQAVGTCVFARASLLTSEHTIIILQAPLAETLPVGPPEDLRPMSVAQDPRAHQGQGEALVLGEIREGRGIREVQETLEIRLVH